MLSLFFTFLAGVCAQAQQTQIFTEAPLAPNPTRYEIKAEFNFISTNNNFPASGGQATGLFSGGKYSDALAVLQLQYDIDRAWRVYGGISGARADATGIDNSGNTDSEHTTSFDEVWLGMQYWYRRHGYSIVPELDFTAPLFQVDLNGDGPLPGEGAFKGQAGLWGELHFSGFTPFVYGGFLYRDSGRSALLPYRVGLRFRQAGSGWVQAEWRGYETAINDVNTSNRNARELYLDHVDGGSFEYYSMNPGHGEFALSGGFEFGDIGIYAAGSLAAYGHESADEWILTAGITIGGKIFTGADTHENNEHYFNTPAKKYDEEYFKESNQAPVVAPTPDEEDVPEIVNKPVAPKPKRRLRPNPNGGPSPDVQLIMKDTEKALENKSK